MRFQLPYRLHNELDEGEGGGGGGEAPLNEGEAPEYLVGNYTADDVASRLGQVSDLHEQLNALEGRFGERLNPLTESLQSLQQAIGQRTAVTPSPEVIAKLNALFTSYDTKFDGVGELLGELLTSSVSQEPLSAEALRPLIDPLLGDRDYQHATRWLDAIEPHLGYSIDDLANLDPANPQTDTQKLFLQFWDRSNQATRDALTSRRQDGSVADPYAYGKALQAFGAFHRAQIQEKTESAGASATRLATGRQTQSAGRPNPSGGRLRTEAEGFASVFKNAS